MGGDIRASRPTGDEIDLLEYAAVLLKRKRMLAAVTASFVAAGIAISLLLPVTYRAECRLLSSFRGAPQTASELLGGLSGLGIPGLEPSMHDLNELYTGILKSRSVRDGIIDRFALQEAYGARYREDARERLEEASDAWTDEHGILVVSVEDEDPERAAAMANAFVDELGLLIKRLALTEAAKRRLFLEEQLAEAGESLRKAEETMALFQEETGALKMDEQAEALINAIAQLKAQMVQKEVQLKVMKTYSTPSNPDLQKTEEELKGLRTELDKLEQGKKNKGYDPLMPAGRMPEVGTQYLRRLRDLKFNETLYELLLKQYETARIEEASDALMLQVIDPAVPPEKKHGPRRAIIAASMAAAGFLLAVFSAFFMEYIERSSEAPERREKIETLKRYLSLRPMKDPLKKPGRCRP